MSTHTGTGFPPRWAEQSDHQSVPLASEAPEVDCLSALAAWPSVPEAKKKEKPTVTSSPLLPLLLALMGRNGGATGLPETEGAACPSVNLISVSPTAGSGRS